MEVRIAVSACLCGIPCRYDGKSKPLPLAMKWWEDGVALPVCPECLGGLPTPRVPCECVGRRVIASDGTDCTAAYLAGARAALDRCRAYGITCAVLKEGSPSCGVDRIYDGTHTGRLVAGMGVTARLLVENGFTVYSEKTVPPDLLQLLESCNDLPSEET